MRIVVYPHAMEIGGSQINAIQLAGAVRDRGHDVTVFSRPGPLVERVTAAGLEHVTLPADRRRPSPATMRQLAGVARGLDIDVVHGYEWPTVVEAAFAARLWRRNAVVGTVMSMSVVPFFPRTVPLVVGTELIREAAAAAGQRHVTLIEPPVDTADDHPGIDGRAFRAAHGVADDEMMVAMVCRLVPELKLEGLLAACDAVGELAAAGVRIRLVIAGDGPAREAVAERAARANAASGDRAVVVLAGEIDDPRGVYAAADVLIGQGGSALRGMAFAKPLVVAGEDGFFELLTPDSAPLFLRQGWYGSGAGGRGSGATALSVFLSELADAPAQRTRLGGFAHQLVLDRFSLVHAAEVQESIYASAVEHTRYDWVQAADLGRCAAGVTQTKLRRRYQRLRGTVAVEDANARPLTEAALAR